MILKQIAIASLLALTAACSSSKVHHSPPQTAETSKAVVRNNGEYYAVLEFDKGTQRLSDASKRDLKEFVASANKDGRTIDDIKILAWADKEYPAKGANLSDRDVKMANERTKSIEKYLKDDLKADGNYATYNMAKRPNKVSEFFRGDDYKTKRVFEKSGAAPTTSSDLTAFMNNKASKALIMVDYEEE